MNIPEGYYQCDQCGGIFEKGWSDDDAKKEKERLFPSLKKENESIVCDDCFRIIMEVLCN